MPVLSRTQRNELFELIQSKGLDPASFTLKTVTTKDAPKDVLAHPETDSFMAFSFHSSHYWLEWWPAFTGATLNALVNGWTDTRDRRGGTDVGVRHLVNAWVEKVKADADAPDLWAEIGKERAILDAANKGTRADVFTAADILALRAAMADIQKYLHTVTDPAKKVLVDVRVQYLIEAAEEGRPKIDWLNIFISQVVAMVIAGVLNPSEYGAFMRHAKAVLGAIFDAGYHLLK